MMAHAAATLARRSMVGSSLRELFRREPRFAGTALVLCVLMLPLLVAQDLDQRVLQGANVWTKPIKFAAALVVYLGALAWFAGRLPAGTTGRRGIAHSQ